MASDKQNPNTAPTTRRKPAHLWKPGQSGNLRGRPPKESSVRSWLKELEDEPAHLENGVAEQLKKRIGYKPDWSRARLLAEVIQMKAMTDKDWAKMWLEYTIGRPVPLTDMPLVQVANVIQGSEKKPEDPFKLSAMLIKVLIEKGVLKAETFEGNGKANGHDTEG